MYASQQFKGGKTIELFTAHGKDPLSKLRLTGGRTIKKEFDPIIKGYVLSLNGSPANSRIHLPKAEKKGMGLDHSFLLFQISIPRDSITMIELAILDTTNTKRKLQLSPWQQEMSISPLTMKLPLPVPLNQWHWLIINLDDLVTNLLQQNYQSLETVSVCGYCRIRCIAAARGTITSLVDMPSSWQPPPSIPPLELINIDSSVIHSIASSIKKDSIPKHVAFGEKIAIPGHILNSSQQSTSITKPLSQHKDMSLTIAPKSPKQKPLPKKLEREDLIPKLPKPQDPILNIPGPQNPTPEPQDPIPKFQDPIPEPQDYIPKSQNSIPKSKPKSQHAISQDSISESKPTSLIPKPTGLVPKPQAPVPKPSLGLKPKPSTDVFSYTSPPHSASKHKTRQENTLDEDFLSLSMAATKNPTDQRYNWQRYHSGTSSSSDNEEEELTPPINMSLSTRIKSGITRRSDVTHETEDLEQSINEPVHDIIDTSGMGGPLTPSDDHYMTNITNDDNDDKLELLYDPDLNYFYDPKTGKYYELTN